MFVYCEIVGVGTDALFRWSPYNAPLWVMFGRLEITKYYIGLYWGGFVEEPLMAWRAQRGKTWHLVVDNMVNHIVYTCPVQLCQHSHVASRIGEVVLKVVLGYRAYSYVEWNHIQSLVANYHNI